MFFPRFIATWTSSPGTSPKTDSGAGLTHCSRTCRALRCSSIPRLRPSQFHRWSLARIRTSTECSRASPGMLLPVILDSIFDAVEFNLTANSFASASSSRSHRGGGFPQAIRIPLFSILLEQRFGSHQKSSTNDQT